MIKYPVPLLGFAAYSGTGKTTLICKVIPLLKAKGIRLAVVKNSHHDIEIDKPNKDSYKLRHAGAAEMIITSPKRTAIIIEHPELSNEPTLEETLKRIQTEYLDLVLIEGFKTSEFPKIEIHRQELNNPAIYPKDENIVAIATDTLLKGEEIPHQLDLNKPEEISNFILKDIIKIK